MAQQEIEQVESDLEWVGTEEGFEARAGVHQYHREGPLHHQSETFMSCEGVEENGTEGYHTFYFSPDPNLFLEEWEKKERA